MAVAGALVQLVAAALLVVAAAAKLAAPRELRATITALGLRPAPLLAAALPVAELGTAVALAAAPSAPLTQAAVVALGALFAAVGLVARRRGGGVACACFGGAHGRELGLRQVAALPGWVAAALLPAAWGTDLAGRAGTLALAWAVVACAGAAGLPLLRLARANRAYLEVARR